MAKKSGMTLTQFTYYGRLTVKYGLIALVVMMVGRVSVNTFAAVWRALNPPPPPPPTVGFGSLPSIRFPDRADITEPDTYVLETPNASFPVFSDRAKVFFMPQSSLGLLNDQQARSIAQVYGYVFEPEILSSRIYRWTKSQPINSTLQIDIQSLTFTLTTDYLSRPELLSSPNLPDNFAAVDTVKDFLDRTVSAPDMATASGEIVYKKNVANELDDAVSLSDADYIQVDLNRTPVDDLYRMYTPEGYKGTVHAIITGALQGQNRIVHLENNYHQVDYSQVHTYPLRAARDAWQIMRSGEGYVASFDGEGQAVIRSVSLGYYDDFEEQSYLQPVYVFEGDDEFVGYVSAIDPTYIQN